MNTCATCRFFNVVYEHHYAVGQCRRHAPVIGGELGVTAWPKVEPEFWCGDFEIKPEFMPCKTCDQVVGQVAYQAPHLKWPVLYPICKTCHDAFAAGTHPFQQEKTA